MSPIVATFTPGVGCVSKSALLHLLYNAPSYMIATGNEQAGHDLATALSVVVTAVMARRYPPSCPLCTLFSPAPPPVPVVHQDLLLTLQSMFSCYAAQGCQLRQGHAQWSCCFLSLVGSSLQRQEVARVAQWRVVLLSCSTIACVYMCNSAITVTCNSHVKHESALAPIT